MWENAILTITQQSTPVAILILAVYVRQLVKSIENIKENVVWQDEFKQFMERFTSLENRVNNRFNGGGS